MTIKMPKTEFKSKRLAALFAETWAELPAKDRRAILGRLFLVTDSMVYCPPDNQSPAPGHAPGYVHVNTLWLSAQRLARRKPEYVRDVIAHELAHVFLEHADNPNLEPGQMESAAIERVKTWKFKPHQSPEEAAELEKLWQYWKEMKKSQEVNDVRIRKRRTGTRNQKTPRGD